LKPFENESDVARIGKLTIENRSDRITIYGSLDITRDKAGQASANELKVLVDAIVARLAGEALPEAITFAKATQVKNPFK
jgi:hypothetical protein